MLLAIAVAVLIDAPAPPGSGIASVATHTIFLDRGGASVRPGDNDARRETSILVAGPTVIPAWAVSDADWATTLACVRDLWAPFAVTVTDLDPGTNTPHLQAVIGGVPGDLDMPLTAAGVSPMRSDCGVIESSIVFVFPRQVHDDPQLVCEIVSQEIGHSFGLDHELDPDDPMTYLHRTGPRTFQDHEVACGEFSARPCGNTSPACRTTQSSFAILRSRLGAAPTIPDPTAPDASTDPAVIGYGEPGGCMVGAPPSLLFALLAALLPRRRPRRRRR